MRPAGRPRLFLAVPVPAPVLRQLERATSAMRERWPEARWAPLANQHITLKFLGSVDEDLVVQVGAAASAVASEHAGADVHLTHPGVFPSRRRAKVLWMGLDDPQGVLSSLAAGLATRLEELGFPPEQRPFRAHLTLARFPDPVRIAADLPDLDLTPAGFAVDRVELFRSHLNPKGARYEVLGSFLLGGPT